MHRVVSALSALVRRSPATVVIATIVLTGVFGFLSGQARMSEGNEGFSPENRELRALEAVGERFSDSSETVMQVLVTTDGAGDVISADGLRAVRALEDAIRSSNGEDALADTPERPAILSFLSPVQRTLAAGEDASGTVEDAQVDAAFQQAVAGAPPEQSAIFRRLVGQSGSVEEARAPAGLVLVFVDAASFVDASEEEFDAVVASQRAIADAVRAADLPEGIEAEPFAFELLFGDQDDFQTEIGRLFALAFLIILVILGFVYFVRPTGRLSWLQASRRTIADVGLTLVTISASIAWMQGVGVLLGPDYLGVIGEFSPPTQIVPILLIGLGVDYAIHLMSRYREEIGQGRDPDSAAATASRTVGIALVLATLTTAVGFLTNVTNPLPALKDFGILSAVGIAVAFLLMLTFVPSVRLLLDRRGAIRGSLPREALRTSTEDRLLPRLMARTSVLAERFAIVTLVVTIGFGVLGGYGLTRLSTEFSFTDFVPQDSPALATLERIEEDFGGGFGETTNVLVEGDVARPQVHNALADASANLTDTEGVLTFGDLPAVQSPVTVLQQLLTQGPFADVARDTGVQPDGTVTPDADVAALYERMLEVAPDIAGGVIARDDAGGFTVLADLQTEAGEAGAETLAGDLAEDFAPVADTGVEVTPTSNNIVSAVIVSELQNSQVVSLIITLSAAMLLLVVTFWVQVRRPFLGVITAAPVVLVVLWTFGMMAATGIPFGPITAVLSALAIGIGVPFTIHITHRFREDRVRYDDPEQAIASTVRHTGGALAGSAMTTIAGFAVLITSSLVPFRQMGQVTAYAIAFAFIAAVLVLPSMLVLWDRWHRRRGDAVLEAPREGVEERPREPAGDTPHP